MHPARFVSYCFVYSGALLVAMHLLLFSPGRWLVTIGNAATGLIIVATGGYRIVSERGEQSPEKYSLITYVMGAFALLVTALFLVALSIAW
ncbi:MULTISPECIES: hypothetical protein [Saliphagus]|uniref:Uncharacterized protein n=1 Tax=Saliphagus infecundisoli TaxID=1849069 RepID=A0ABD5QK58_9EURY|nr:MULTISPECIES: hypothetical protein [Saliphagus]